MKIYIAYIADRHTDVDAEVFTSPEPAIAFAKHAAKEYARFPEDYEESQIDGWLFYAQYSVEGDRVWVVEKTLQEDKS